MDVGQNSVTRMQSQTWFYSGQTLKNRHVLLFSLQTTRILPTKQSLTLPEKYGEAGGAANSCAACYSLCGRVFRHLLTQWLFTSEYNDDTRHSQCALRAGEKSLFLEHLSSILALAGMKGHKYKPEHFVWNIWELSQHQAQLCVQSLFCRETNKTVSESIRRAPFASTAALSFLCLFFFRQEGRTCNGWSFGTAWNFDDLPQDCKFKPSKRRPVVRPVTTAHSLDLSSNKTLLCSTMCQIANLGNVI